MKRLFPTSLALLLVLGSLGHVVAATLCPRSLGRACCFASTSKHTHDSSSCHRDVAMHSMPMNGMPMDDMAMEDTSALEVPYPFSLTVVDEEVLANPNILDQPVEFCAHCMSHSGIPNAPASFVTTPDESRKAVDSVPLPLSSFLGPSLTAISQNGLPREHAPPGTSAPRHVLNSVLLI